MEEELSSYFENPEFKEILQKYESMVNDHTPAYFDAENLTDIAEYYTHSGKETNAENTINYALQLYPNNTDVLIFKIRSLVAKGKRDEAYQWMNRIEDTSDREVKFLKADLMIDEKRYNEADDIFEELAESEDHSMEILTDITISYIDAELKEYAYKWLKRIEERGYSLMNSQRYRNVWCDFYMTFAGEEEKAEKAFQLSIDKHPYSIIYWNGLAKCYLAQMKIQEAHEAVDFALAIDNRNMNALETKGYCYILCKNYESAISVYQKTLSINDQRGNIYRSLAHCYLETDKIEEALNCYNEWLKRCKAISNYEKSEIYGYISMCYCNLDMPKEGMEYINASLDLNPFQTATIIQKGTLHLQLNEHELAEQMFSKAISITPEDEIPYTIVGIAHSYFYMKDYPKTIQWGEIVLNEYPEEDSILIPLFYSYLELGQPNKCLLTLKNVLDKMSSNPHKHQHLKESLKELIKDFNNRNNPINFNFDDLL